MTTQEFQKKIKRVLITEQEIQDKIQEVGAQISREYEGKPLLLVSILNGAFVFMADPVSYTHFGDDIWLNLVMKDGVIQDASFNGDGCAISQASADIMLGMIIGKTKAEALHLSDLFLKMIKGTATDAEVEELEEASALQDISHMPARVKCAVLGWRTLREAIEKLDSEA